MKRRLRHRSLPAALALSLTSMTVGGSLGAAGLAVLAGAWGLVGLALVPAVAGASALALALVPRRRVRLAAVVFLAAALARTGLAVLPRDGAGATIESRWLDAPEGRRPFFGGIRERDVVALGLFVGLGADEYEGCGKGRALLEWYAAPSTGSVLLDTWAVDRGHFWLGRRPEGAGPFPLLVFLHGHGGSFQVYPEVLAEEARRRGFLAVFPADGFGLWKGVAARVERTVEAVAREHPLDRERVHLVALSAGVLGAFRTPGYASLVAISGPAPEPFEPSRFRGTRVLLIHGPEDWRVPIAGVRKTRDALVAAGVETRLDEIPGDHLILVTRRPEVVRRIFEWIH